LEFARREGIAAIDLWKVRRVIGFDPAADIRSAMSAMSLARASSVGYLLVLGWLSYWAVLRFRRPAAGGCRRSLLLTRQPDKLRWFAVQFFVVVQGGLTWHGPIEANFA
jgi:hypothetical protein